MLRRSKYSAEISHHICAFQELESPITETPASTKQRLKKKWPKRMPDTSPACILRSVPPDRSTESDWHRVPLVLIGFEFSLLGIFGGARVQMDKTPWQEPHKTPIIGIRAWIFKCAEANIWNRCRLKFLHYLNHPSCHDVWDNDVITTGFQRSSTIQIMNQQYEKVNHTEQLYTIDRKFNFSDPCGTKNTAPRRFCQEGFVDTHWYVTSWPLYVHSGDQIGSPRKFTRF